MALHRLFRFLSAAQGKKAFGVALRNRMKAEAWGVKQLLTQWRRGVAFLESRRNFSSPSVCPGVIMTAQCMMGLALIEL
jgi:hypothetical protein